MKFVSNRFKLAFIFFLVSFSSAFANEPRLCALKLRSEGLSGSSTGSAVFVMHQSSGNYYIITAYHNVYQKTELRTVLDESSFVSVPLTDFVEASFSYDPAQDVAIFKCSSEGRKRLEGEWRGLHFDRRAILLKDGSQVPTGSHVVAIGNPQIKILTRDVTPLNLVAGATVSEYATLGQRLGNIAIDPAARNTNLLFLENLHVTYGFSGGPVIYSASNFSSDDSELAGMIQGGDPTNQAFRSWAIPAQSIATAVRSYDHGVKSYPPAQWTRPAINTTAYSSPDESFISLVQVTPFQATEASYFIPLTKSQNNDLSLTVRASGQYTQLAAALKPPTSIEVLDSPAPMHVNQDRLFTFHWTVRPSANAEDGKAEIEFYSESGKYSFRLELNLRIIDESPKFDITTLQDNEVPLSVWGGGHAFAGDITYLFNREKDLTKIYPEFPYLKSYLGGGPIDYRTGFYSFELLPPVLSLKMFNNSNRPVDVSEIRIDVNSVTIDKEPLLRIESITLPQSLTFYNEGWGKVIDPKASFSFRQTEPVSDADWKARPSDVMKFDTFDHETQVDLNPYIPGDLRKGGNVWVFGTISYRTEDNQERSVRFKTIVGFGQAIAGGNVPPSYRFSIKLDPDRSGYSISTPVSRLIQAGELEHLALKVYSPKSAFYELTFVFRNSAGSEFQKTKVNLHIIRPRSMTYDADFMRPEQAETVGSVATIPELVTDLYDSSSITRGAAILRLSEIGLPAKSALVVALNHSDKNVRIGAIRALGKLGYEAVSDLLAVRFDGDSQIRNEVNNALMSEGALSGLNKTLWSNYLAEKSGGIKAEELELLANSPDRNHLDTAAAIYAWRGDKARADSLATRALDITSRRVALLHSGQRPLQVELSINMNALKDQSPNVKFRAMSSLEEMGSKAAPAVDLLAANLSDRSIINDEDAHICCGLTQEVRYFAIETLASIGPPAASTLPSLLRLLESQDSEDRRNVRNVIEAIGKIGLTPGQGEGQIAQALRDPDINVRRRAAKILANLGAKASKESIDALVDAFKTDPHADNFLTTRAEFVDALGIISPRDEQILSVLVSALTDRKKFPQWNTERAIGKIGPNMIPQLMSHFRQPQYRVEIADILFEWVGTLSIKPLISELRNPDPRTRSLAARTLGRFGPDAAEATTGLRALQLDSDESVRSAAAEALARIVGG